MPPLPRRCCRLCFTRYCLITLRAVLRDDYFAAFRRYAYTLLRGYAADIYFAAAIAAATGLPPAIDVCYAAAYAVMSTRYAVAGITGRR